MKFITLLFLVFFYACSNSNYDSSESKASLQVEEIDDYDIEEEQSGTDADVLDLRIIRIADFRIKVKDVERSTSNIEGMVKNHQGYVANSNLNNTGYRIESGITIRVPSDKFESLLENAAKEAIYINYKNINAKDVSEEYLDIETRLKTKKEVRARYEEILRSKAKTVKDVLSAEEAIRVLQEEIEAKEGRLRYLKNHVQYSTINLSLYQELDYQQEPNTIKEAYSSKLLRSVKSGWDIILSLILGIVTIWPLLLIAVVVFTIWRRRSLASKK